MTSLPRKHSAWPQKKSKRTLGGEIWKGDVDSGIQEQLEERGGGSTEQKWVRRKVQAVHGLCSTGSNTSKLSKWVSEFTARALQGLRWRLKRWAFCKTDTNATFWKCRYAAFMYCYWQGLKPHQSHYLEKALFPISVPPLAILHYWSWTPILFDREHRWLGWSSRLYDILGNSRHPSSL